MRSLLLTTAVLCLAASPAFASWPHFFADAGVSTAKRQQDVNHLLYRVSEPLRFSDLKAIAESFNPVADISIYKDGGAAAQKLVDELENHRLLKQHHWFSLFNTRQREEALMLFDVFMSCTSWECAVNNAAYFRENMNEGEFTYAVYAALVHSSLGKGVILPPLYEITPHMFTDSEVISKAYSAQMTQTPGKFDHVFKGSRNPEQRVAYFGEDIGLNSHHVTWHLDFPFWWEDSYGYHLHRKGELFFWAHHQLTARFDAERLSNYLDVVDELYWDRPIEEGFAPHTTYKYGGEFPARPDNVKFEDVEGIVRVRDVIIMETRIRDAIASGFITKRDGTHIDINNAEGIDHLGDIIESSMYSPNTEYYGALHNYAHILLGRQGDPHGKFNLPPGVMEHFETATRDPAFFRLHKYMDNIFKEHKDTLKPYTKEEVEFAGIEVSASVKGKLETFFEEFEFNLNNAVDASEGMQDMEMKSIEHRLNHEEFDVEYHISNNNNEAKHGVVRTYLCPRRNTNGIVYSFDEGRWNCIEMDKFWVKLEPGNNVVTRKSTESSVTVPDIPSFEKLMHDADAAVASGSDLHLEAFERSCGIPNRLLLPRGNEDGMEFGLAIAVTDASGDDAHHLENAHLSHAQCGVTGEEYPDHKPMGFPLDRPIPDERLLLGLSNTFYDVVTVTHRGDH